MYAPYSVLRDLASGVCMRYSACVRFARVCLTPGDGKPPQVGRSPRDEASSSTLQSALADLDPSPLQQHRLANHGVARSVESPYLSRSA